MADPAGPVRFSPDALRADLRFAIDTIVQQHPDLSHSVPRERLEEAAAELRRQLDHPMDQAEAWAALAQLNPVLADGHLFIGLPDWRGQTRKDIDAGIGFFPFEIDLDPAGYPVIMAALGGSATKLAGRRVMKINGRDARLVARALLARTHGDSPIFRAALLSQRWWLFHARLYGTPTAYELVLQDSNVPLHMPAAHTLPAILQQEASFERSFTCSVNADGSARLTVASFVWDDKDRFLQFTHDCFARIKAAAIDRLVIDVSTNGGGNDDMWKEGILRYIADRPYKQGSTYRKREKTGGVSTGAIESATLPVMDEPLHFSGKLSVQIGPLTYSSAVLFSNVVRDYGFGSLTGTGGAARTRQSGGVQGVTLPNTGLPLSYPRFVLDPPAGPDIGPLLVPAPP